MEKVFKNADTLLEILELLPIVDVIRYRSVCSEWRKLIDKYVLKEVILQIDGVPSIGVWEYNSQRMDPKNLIWIESYQVLENEHFQSAFHDLRRLCVNMPGISEPKHNLFTEIERFSKLEHLQIVLFAQNSPDFDAPSTIKHQNLKTFSVISNYPFIFYPNNFLSYGNAFHFPNLEFLSYNSLRSGYGLENLRHLKVSGIEIHKNNRLKNLEILELIYISKYMPVGQYALWLPKLKELHIQEIENRDNAIKILNSVREAMKRKSFRFIYMNVEFCDELIEEPHYSSRITFTEYQLYFLRKYWSRLSSRPIHQTRLHYVGDQFRGLDDRFVRDKLVYVYKLKLSQASWCAPDETFSSQDEIVSFLRNFKSLQTLYLQVCSVDQQFYDSLPDFHPYLQRLYFSILSKEGTYETQMQLPDLHFLTRFKYLFDFDSHHLNLPFEWGGCSQNLESLMPVLDEHQKLIIDRIRKKGTELGKKAHSKGWRLSWEELGSAEEFDDCHFPKDIIYITLDFHHQMEANDRYRNPAYRHFHNINFVLPL